MLARVVAKDPVPEPVTSPVRVIVWSPVFVPEVLARTASSASVTYLLLVESAMSAVVASAHEVTNPFES